MADPPADLAPYRATPDFTAATVPAGLTRDHRTGPGVWGRIEVLAGTMTLTRAAGAANRLAVGDVAWVAPGETHAVALAPDAVFRVVFHRRRPEGG